MGVTRVALRSNIKNRFLSLLLSFVFYLNYCLDVINTKVISFIKTYRALYKGPHVEHIFEV